MRIATIAVISFIFAEVVSLVLAGRWLGIGWTLFWLAADVAIGVFLIRSMFRTILRQMGDERHPGAPLIGFLAGAQLRILGGLLLIIPGFASDLIALILVLPPVRNAVRRKAEAWSRTYHRSPPGGAVIEGEAVEVDGPAIDGPRDGDSPAR